MSKLAYNVREAAEATGLSYDRISRAIKAGELPARATSRDKNDEPRGRRIILATDLTKFLDGLPAA
jgi:hypothetical protein